MLPSPLTDLGGMSGAVPHSSLGHTPRQVTRCPHDPHGSPGELRADLKKNRCNFPNWHTFFSILNASQEHYKAGQT